ncbi:hypothetical protein Tco_1096574, partial [Tanacetum coccineum]
MLLALWGTTQADRQGLLNATTIKIQGVPDGQAVQTIIPNNAAFQTEDLDTYDSDCHDILNAQEVLMANISNYGFDTISEVSHSETNLNDMENQSVLAIHDFEQSPVVDFTDNEIHSDSNIIPHEKMIDSQMDDMIIEKIALKEQVDSLEQNLSKQIKEKECLLQTFTVFKSESKEKEDKYMKNETDLEKKIKELDNIIFKVGYQNPFHLKKAQRIKPTLYDGIVMSDKHVDMPVIDDEETLILEDKSRSKMSKKAKDPEVINKNISHKPIDYENKPSDALPVKIEAPKELPKISLVNESLKKLNFHLAKFDNVVKIRTTPNARTEGEWGFKHTKAVFNNEIIPFLKSLKDIFNVFDRDLLNKIIEVKTILDQMNVAVQQTSVDKQSVMNSMLLIAKNVNMDGNRKESCNLEAELLKSQNAFNDLLKSYSKLEKHCISLELSIQLNQEFFQKDDSCNNQNALEILEFFENNNLKDQLQDKDSTILKGKQIVDIATQIPSTNTIVPGMFKLDLEPLAPRLLQNREAHLEYLKYTHEQANILSRIVKQAKAKQPLDKELDFVCKHAQRIQELLVESSKTSDSNTPVLSFTGLKCSTSKCKSKPTGNKRNDRISQTPSRNIKNKVEAQPRKVNKKNCVVKPVHDVDVKHLVLNANSRPICATCKKSLFDDVHDMCLLDFVKNVNSRAKSAKKHKKQNIWKPTSHVFTKRNKDPGHVTSRSTAQD